MFGEVQVYWNITPAVFSEFEVISGTVTMRDRQSDANITLKVPKLKSSLNFDIYIHYYTLYTIKVYNDIFSLSRSETMTSLKNAMSTCSQ